MFNGSYIIYVICVCLLIVVFNTYCGVFLLCLSSFCVPYVPSFYGQSMLIALRYSLTFIETTKFRFILDRCFIIFYIHKSIINIMKFNFFCIFTQEVTLSLNVFRQAITLVINYEEKSTFCDFIQIRLIYLLLFNVKWLSTISAILLTRTNLQTIHHALGKRRQYGRRMAFVLINTRDNHLTSRSGDTILLCQLRCTIDCLLCFERDCRLAYVCLSLSTQVMSCLLLMAFMFFSFSSTFLQSLLIRRFC